MIEPVSNSGGRRPPFTGYFKLIYVCADLEKSAPAFFNAFGTHEFDTRRDVILKTPDGGEAVVDMSSAWIGALQADLVQAKSDSSGYFAAQNVRPKLHSTGRLFASTEDAEAMVSRTGGLGYAVRPLADNPEGRLFSIDSAILGHSIEGIVLPEAERERLQRLPGIGTQQSFNKGQAPFPGFYQFTYITNDFDKAKAVLCDLHGMKSFMEFTPLEVPLKDNQIGRMNCALSYVGAMEIEVMNPVDGAVQIYTDMMPESDFVIRHHHISRLFADYDSFEGRGREFAAWSHPPIADNFPGERDVSRFYYVDCREETGHYLESAIFDGDTRAWIDTIPRI